MHPKFLIWIGIGLLAATGIIVLVWVGLAGFLPQVSLQIDPPEVNLQPIGALAQKGLDMVTQAIAKTVQLAANFLQITSRQLIDAFRMPAQ